MARAFLTGAAIALAVSPLALPVAGRTAPRQLTPSIERGAEVSQALCAACHGVALEPASPVRDAPLFRVLSRVYSGPDLARKLGDISENGHFEMPRLSLREDEIEDVSAYIASLDGADERPSGHKTRSSRRVLKP